VVVQGNRLAAAACFLPLTVNPELSRTLGSRHRAAIGLTEDTDAVAIVVSEESGAISIVEGGRIRRGLDGPALKQALLASLGLAEAPAAAEAAEPAATPGEKP
jgi:diadenylate cyclase